MSKNEYLAALKACLMSLPTEERDAAVKYYEEFFEDAGDGNEQSVIDELGSPQSLAESIIADANRTERSSTEYIPANRGEAFRSRSSAASGTQRTQQADPIPQSGTVNRRNNTVMIVLLLILASPILIPIAGAAFGILVGILAALFGIWVACGGVVLGFSIGGIGMFFFGLAYLFHDPLAGLLLCGAGLVLFALGLLLLIPFVAICAKAIPAIIRGIVNLFSRLFHRSRATA